MANRMNVYRDGQPIYDIVMGTSFSGLKDEAMSPSLKDHKIYIMTDSNVAKLYLEEVTAILSECYRKVSVYVFSAGGENKNLDTIERLCEHLILEHFDRRDMLATLGSGVVEDLYGSAAATYLRGVRSFQTPTTFLSQMDSSIGGKTSVDFDVYKSMVGAFHTPRFVYTNLSTLLTLSNKRFSSGMGEMIKHGLIKDKECYQWLKGSRGGVGARDPTLCQKIVFKNNRIRKQVVEMDPAEQRERVLLNFGRILDYAVEKLKGFTMLHSHCVGLGCIATGYISYKRGMIIEEEFGDLRSVFDTYGLPITVDGLTWDEVRTAAKSGRRVDAGVVKFILLRSMGNAYMDRTVSDDEMKEGFDCIGGHKE